MKLILMRHAKAGFDEVPGGDHERPLSARGKGDARRIGRWLSTRGHLPTRVLCSDALRTIETWEGLAIDGGEVTMRPDLYLAPAETILALARHTLTDALMIVAHNPGIARAAHEAAADAPDHAKFAKFSTGACLVVDMAEGLPGPVVDFAVPGDLD